MHTKSRVPSVMCAVHVTVNIAHRLQDPTRTGWDEASGLWHWISRSQRVSAWPGSCVAALTFSLSRSEGVMMAHKQLRPRHVSGHLWRHSIMCFKGHTRVVIPFSGLLNQEVSTIVLSGRLLPLSAPLQANLCQHWQEFYEYWLSTC